MAEKYPDGIEVSRNADNDVRLRLQYDGEPDRMVYLDQPRLVQLIAQLQEKISSSRISPISKDLVRPGQRFLAQGHASKLQPDGSLHLQLIATVDHRTVIVPFELSSADVNALRDELGPPSPSS
jgi:hypothetical protein